MFPNPYQITDEDDDLLTTANNLGIPYEALVAANPNIQSVSQGQYINVPSVNANNPLFNPNDPTEQMSISGSNEPYRGQSPALSLYGSSLGDGPGAIGKLGENVLPTPAVNNRFYTSRPYGNNNAIEGEGQADIGIGGGFTSGGYPSPESYQPPVNPNPQVVKDSPVSGRLQAIADTIRLQNLQTTLANATSPDQLPVNVPATDAFKLGYTPEDMRAAGYVFYRGTYKKAEVASINAAPSVVTAGTPQSSRTTDEYGNAWNPATAQTDVYGGRFVQEGAKRWVRTSGGRLVREVAVGGRWRKAGRQARVKGQTPQPVIRADTPSTTLDLVLGT